MGEGDELASVEIFPEELEKLNSHFCHFFLRDRTIMRNFVPQRQLCRCQRLRGAESSAAKC